MTAKELIKMIEAAGWYEARQQGSHRIFKHPDKPDNLAIPDHGKKDISKGLLQNLLKKAGLR